MTAQDTFTKGTDVRYYPKGISTCATSTEWIDTKVRSAPRHTSTGRLWVTLEKVGPVPLDKVEKLPVLADMAYGC